MKVDHLKFKGIGWEGTEPTACCEHGTEPTACCEHCIIPYFHRNQKSIFQCW